MEAIRAYVYMVGVLTLCVATQGQAATDSLLENRMAMLEKQGSDQGKLITELLERLENQDHKVQAQAQTIQGQNLRLDTQEKLLQEQSQTLEETRLMLRQHSKTTEKLQSIVRRQAGQIQSQIRALQTLQYIVNRQASLKSYINTNDENFAKTVGVKRENVDTARGINTVSVRQRTRRSLESMQNKRLVLDADGPVAFHAVIDKTETAHIGQNQNIIFGVVVENLGGGYHNQHGIFIAPANGVYVFSVSIMSYINAHPEVQVGLKKDGVVLAKAFAHGDNGKADQGSVTVVTKLTQGNEVWVSLEYPNDDSILGQRFTSFTGSLLYRM